MGLQRTTHCMLLTQFSDWTTATINSVVYPPSIFWLLLTPWLKDGLSPEDCSCSSSVGLLPLSFPSGLGGEVESPPHRPHCWLLSLSPCSPGSLLFYFHLEIISPTTFPCCYHLATRRSLFFRNFKFNTILILTLINSVSSQMIISISWFLCSLNF